MVLVGYGPGQIHGRRGHAEIKGIKSPGDGTIEPPGESISRLHGHCNI